jgi:trk system potassium uptake protein TrkH
MVVLTEKRILLTYFFSIILLGAAILLLPVSWNGETPISKIDAFFTSVSAVCVTGLITVDTALFSRFGQFVIAILIQLGGLGIISFSSLYLVIPSRGLSLKGGRLIRAYYLDSVEYEPLDIIKQIVFITLVTELAGMALLYYVFKNSGVNNPFFVSFFHTISAFCNAGFSTFSNSLEDYRFNTVLNITVMFLIIMGGLGFVLMRDLIKTATMKNRHLSIHTKIVLFVSLLLIILSASVLFFSESDNILAGMKIKDRLVISFFQAVTPRTAGFNTIPINNLGLISKLTIIPLMFIGAAPGSIAGGVKVTTFFIVMLVLFRKMDTNKNITVFKRNITSDTILKALVFIVKAAAILFLSIFLLSISEFYIADQKGISLFEIIFECFSAFGTVGLSLGITGSLSFLGKTIIISTMLMGRFGLLIIAMNIFKTDHNITVDYPDEEVLIG